MRFRIWAAAVSVPCALAWVVCALAWAPGEVGAQVRLDLLYGAERNVDDGASQHDGWMNATVEWVLQSGVGIGIGTDHQFEEATPSTSGHLGWAIYLSSSYSRRSGRWSPFVRGGVGAGRAPCVGDTCGDGLFLRGSAGARLHLSRAIGLTGEVGLSRVSRPFGGFGLSIRP